MSLQKTLKALSDPSRRQILNYLKSGSMTAGELAEHFSFSSAALSKHLSVLKEAELVRDFRRGQYIDYTLNTSVLEDVMLWIQDLKGDEMDENEPEKI